MPGSKKLRFSTPNSQYFFAKIWRILLWPNHMVLAVYRNLKRWVKTLKLHFYPFFELTLDSLITYIGWATSIYPTHQWTNPYIYWEWMQLNISVFLSWPFWFWFRLWFFFLLHAYSNQSQFMYFYNYPKIQPKYMYVDIRNTLFWNFGQLVHSNDIF